MPALARSIVVIFVAALVLAGLVYARGTGDEHRSARKSGAISVRVDRSDPAGTSQLALGVTHTQYSLDPWGDPAAVQRGKELVQRVARLQNQHIYGWGALNPEPQPGVFDWSSLDRRVELMRSTGATPVITLCCAPDWMTQLGTPTTSYPNLPPTPDHYDEFAQLAARVARRYPDVRHFMVWNEFKGFYDDARRRWDVEAYTRMYNAVYAALKAVDPAIEVGGPYLVVEGTGSRDLGRDGHATAPPITARDRYVLDYWLAHAAGADFVVIDRNVRGARDHNRYSRAEYLELTRWFEDVTRQVRRMTKLPVWFAEDYFRDDRNWRFQAAGLASVLAAEVRGGAAASLRWGPQGSDDAATQNNPQSLFSDTHHADGGQPFPAFFVYEAFAQHFGPGTPLVRATSSSPSRVSALASPDVTLLINRRPRTLKVELDGRSLRLKPYEVRAVPANR
jgi:hypothetical protein